MYVFISNPVLFAPVANVIQCVNTLFAVYVFDLPLVCFFLGLRKHTIIRMAAFVKSATPGGHHCRRR